MKVKISIMGATLDLMRNNPDSVFYINAGELLSGEPRQGEVATEIEIDKPAPVDGGEIVEKAERLSEAAFSHCGPEFKHKRMKAFARTIQAGIQKNTEGIKAVEKEIKEVDKRRYEGHLAFLEERQHLYDKIEAVRKLFRNHEKRITELSAWQTIYQVIIDQLPSQVRVYDLERKVEKLEKGLTKAHRESFDFGRGEFEPLRRKVEQIGGIEDRLRGLQTRVYCLEGHDPKPRPSARCKDEKGVEHDLIPGRSVIGNTYCSDNDRALFLKHSPDLLHSLGGDLSCVWLTKPLGSSIGGTKTLWSSKSSIFLFNLDFPGGDK